MIDLATGEVHSLFLSFAPHALQKHKETVFSVPFRMTYPLMFWEWCLNR